MFKKKGLSFLVILILAAFAFTGKATAANMYFAVPAEVVNVSITTQGTMVIDYQIDFDNTKGGSVIDYVDIGLPNQSYVLSSITADVDGKAITDIQKGDPRYISIGVTLGLGSNAIQPGSKGQLHLKVGQVGNMLNPYVDSSKPDYASFEFVPNTFGAQYVTGTTDLTVALHMPKGVLQDEPVYFPAENGWPGNTAPDGTLDDQGYISYTWHATAANVYTGYKFGGAFPAKYVPASAIVQPVKNNSSNNSGGSSSSGSSIEILGILVFLGFGGYALYSWAVNREKMAYDSPQIAIEGLGVKRGLTAVEAAVLLEKPVDKILSMILFSVIKKGAASIVSQDPLKLEVTSPPPADLRPYEIDFLNAINPVGMDAAKLQTLMVTLINRIRGGMQGFRRLETENYYRDILAKAWAEVEAAGTPEVKSQVFDEQMDWTLMDDNFEQHTRTVFSTMPVISPRWWGRFDPTFKNQTTIPVSTSATVSSGPANAPAVSMPNLPGSQFAASIVKGTSDFSSKTIYNVQAFTASLANKLAPPPSIFSSADLDNSSYDSRPSENDVWSDDRRVQHHSVPIRTHSGGGHHCACACAGGGR